MSELTELITRLEKATGPDRELDQELALIAGLKEICYRVFRGTDGKYLGAAPYYTKLIDAAMALVPKDFRIELEGLNQSWVAVCHSTALGQNIRGEAFTSTPALALCIAALKARQSSPESQSPQSIETEKRK